MACNEQSIDSMVGKGRLIATALLSYFFGILALTVVLINHPLTVNSTSGTKAPRTPKPDFTAIDDTVEKKQAFFDFLRPAIEDNNERILKQREKLLTIKDEWESKQELTKRQKKFLTTLSRQYDIEEPMTDVNERLKELVHRVDIIPESLVLAQAAIESAWGTSRFARKGNNFFGQWCYRQGCGLTPNARDDDATHEVAAFPSVYKSVSSYFKNLNTYHPYEELRSLRAVLRMAEKPLTGMKLASGLTQYSERRGAYVEEVRTIIRVNELE